MTIVEAEKMRTRRANALRGYPGLLFARLAFETSVCLQISLVGSVRRSLPTKLGIFVR